MEEFEEQLRRDNAMFAVGEQESVFEMEEGTDNWC